MRTLLDVAAIVVCVIAWGLVGTGLCFAAWFLVGWPLAALIFFAYQVALVAMVERGL